MEYIIHNRLKENTLSDYINLPYGTKLNCDDNRFIKKDNKVICVIGSEQYNKHIAPNYDNNGLERGKITYTIAYKDLKNNIEGQRFTNNQINIICSKYQKFLIPDIPTILFNQNFFDAPIIELRTMAKDLNIKI